MTVPHSVPYSWPTLPAALPARANCLAATVAYVLTATACHLREISVNACEACWWVNLPFAATGASAGPGSSIVGSPAKSASKKAHGLRRAVELAWAGVCGELRECHVWLANGDGPQERPKDTPPVPKGLDWDLWLGPAPYRPYSPWYLPGSWRRWRDFGSGGGGDMGCHTINMAVRALRLDLLWNPDPADKPAKPPVIRIEAEASEIHPETYPRRIKAKFDFPARGKLPALTVYWYNGGLKPPKEVLRGHAMTDWGCLVGGDKGAVFSDCPWNTRMMLLPEADFKDFKGPDKALPRGPGHHAEWVLACKGGPKPFSNFDIGAPMNEIVQLVHVASLAKKPIDYDPQNCKILNASEANPLLHREYRKGWTL